MSQSVLNTSLLYLKIYTGVQKKSNKRPEAVKYGARALAEFGDVAPNARADDITIFGLVPG